MNTPASSSELPRISPEVSGQIAAHFCIEVYGVEHGHTSEQLAELLPGVDPALCNSTVTNEQRLITQTLADTLGPDDVLFREGYGHGREEADPSFVQEVAAATPELRQAAKDQLTKSQAAHDAISFGSLHALFNGVRVLNADASPEQRAAREASRSEFSPDASRERCVAALSIVLAHAIDILPPEEAPVPEPEQRRHLMLWFGGAHIGDFQRVIDEANLPITAYTTKETQMRAAVLAAAKFIAGGMQNIVDFFKTNG